MKVTNIYNLFGVILIYIFINGVITQTVNVVGPNNRNSMIAVSGACRVTYYMTFNGTSTTAIPAPNIIVVPSVNIDWLNLLNSTLDNTTLINSTIKYQQGITTFTKFVATLGGQLYNIPISNFNCILPPTYTDLNVTSSILQRTISSSYFRFLVTVNESNIDFGQVNRVDSFLCLTSAPFQCMVGEILAPNTMIVQYIMVNQPYATPPLTMNITFKWSPYNYYIKFKIPVFLSAQPPNQGYSVYQYPKMNGPLINIDFWRNYPVVQFVDAMGLDGLSPYDRLFYAPDYAVIRPILGNSSSLVYAAESMMGGFNPTVQSRYMYLTDTTGYFQQFGVSTFNVSTQYDYTYSNATITSNVYKPLSGGLFNIMGYMTLKVQVVSVNTQLGTYVEQNPRLYTIPQPFGIIKTQHLLTTYIYSLPVSLASFGPFKVMPTIHRFGSNVSETSPAPSSTITESLAPRFIDIQMIPRTTSSFFLVIDYETDSRVGLSSVFYNNNNYSTSYLVSGGLFKGRLSIPIDCHNPNLNGFPLPPIMLIDNFGNTSSLELGSYVTPSRRIPLVEPCSDVQLQVSNFTGISFIPNNFDTSNGPTYVSMLFNLSNPTPSLAPTITFYLQNVSFSTTQQSRSIKVQSYFDNILNQFRADLTVPQRLGNESIIYFINRNVYSSTLINQLGEQARLQVSSNNMDKLPPYVTSIQGVYIAGTNPTFGFQLTIQDDYNGFDYGQLNVTSDRDQQVYSFWLRPGGAVGSAGTFTIEVYQVINAPCVNQTFSVKELVLVDKAGWLSYYPLVSPSLPNNYSTQSTYDSFFKIADQSLSNVTITCVEVIDTTPPTIQDFTTTTQSVDIGGIDRTVSFILNTSDSGSGISTRHNPYVYLIDDQGGTVIVPVVKASVSGSSYLYTFETQIPYGVGNNGFLVSMYGLSDNNLNLAYLSTFDLYANVWVYYLNTTFTKDQPVITGSTSVPRAGGQVTLYTRGIVAGTGVIAFVDVGDGKGYTTVNVNSLVTGLLVFNVNTIVSNTSIPVYLSTPSIFSSTASNTWMIPVVDYITIYTPPPPLSCPGTPQCGGSSKGTCTPNGCQCIGQWYGPDCTSFTIIVDKPNVTTTDPTVVIGGGNVPPSIYSIVSIYSIRELSIDGSTIQEYKFKNWTFNNQSLANGDGSINYLYSSLLDSSRTTTLNVTIQWFKQSTNITFAGDQIYLPPSSTKITLYLTSYQFQNELNSIQILMDVELVNKNDGGCSSTSYGTGENGNNNDIGWVKIRTGDTSVYARFIRKGIVDTRLTSISNSIITLSESSSTRSFVGVNVPHFTTSVILDPDISMLLEQDSIQCSKSGLTNAQLAGIIVAGVIVGFVAIALTIFIIKKRYRFVRKGAIIKMVTVN